MGYIRPEDLREPTLSEPIRYGFAELLVARHDRFSDLNGGTEKLSWRQREMPAEATLRIIVEMLTNDECASSTQRVVQKISSRKGQHV